MKYFIYRLLQCTWGLPQTLVGFILFIKYRKCKHINFKGSIVSYWPKKGGVSLGMFTFVEDKLGRQEEVKNHEYGHTIQSLILGPFYLIVVGIPSFIWCNLPYFRKKRQVNRIPYNSFFVERNADYIGGNLKKKDVI